MIKKAVSILIFIIALTIFLLQSCKEDEEIANLSPTCQITSPTEGQEFEIDEVITISAEAFDSDGSISEIRYFVDDQNLGSVGGHDFSVEWDAIEGGIGEHSIKVIAYDNYGMNSSGEVKIEVLKVSGISIGQFIDPRDSTKYDTVQIGTQTWFAENLNYQTADSSWWYNNDSAYGNKYGRLYSWGAALNACPDGWHLPSDEEWIKLELHLGMGHSAAYMIGWRGLDEGTKLKSTSGWYEDANGTDVVGFTGLPNGYRFPDGTYEYLTQEGAWWTATNYEDDKAFGRALGLTGLVGRNWIPRELELAMGVRCVKD